MIDLFPASGWSFTDRSKDPAHRPGRGQTPWQGEPRPRESARERSGQSALETRMLAAFSAFGLGLGIGGARKWLLVPALSMAWWTHRAAMGLRPSSLREAQGSGETRSRGMARSHGKETELLESVELRGPRPPGSSRALKRARRRRWIWPLILGAALLVALRISLTPVAAHFLRKSLGGSSGFSGDFSDLSISLPRLAFVLTNFSLDLTRSANSQKPLLQIKRLEVSVLGGQLLHGRLGAKLRLLEPQVCLPVDLKPAIGTEKPSPTGVLEVAPILEQIIPLRIERVEIKRGVVSIIDRSEKSRPELQISGIEATAENIQTRSFLGKGMPCVIAGSARLATSGKARFFCTADLLAEPAALGGRAEVKGLRLAELNSLIGPKTGLKFKQGEFDVFAAFIVEDGKVSGGVKPFLKNVETEGSTDEFSAHLKSGLADAAISLLSDRVPNREAVAAIIPVRGEISSPSVQVLPTFLTVVRNAFVEGLAAGFDQLPAPGGKAVSFFRKAAQALSPGGEPLSSGPTGSGGDLEK